MHIPRLKTRPSPACQGGRKIITRRDSPVIEHIDCGHPHPVGICPKCKRGHGLKIALSDH